MASVGESFHIIPAAQMADLDSLLPVLESAIVSPFEGDPVELDIELVLSSVQASIEGRDDGEYHREYLIAETPAGKALGMMGLQEPPEPRMLPYSLTGNPAEIINAYVDARQRGSGIGRVLLRNIEALAVARGHEELLVNSGPRYEQTGWPFWTRMYGFRVAVAHHLYGPGAHAHVWRKFLYQAN